MNRRTSSARSRLMALAGFPAYRDGGPVRGPGTGTSDDVLDRVRPGTFIMPADSTEALGHSALAKAGERVPVRLSNGEHKLSPEQVYAIGLQTLESLKDATHTPVAERAPSRRLGARERLMRLADGGMVSDVKRDGNSYSGMSVGGNITVNGQPPGGTFTENAGNRPAPTASPAPTAGTATTTPVPAAAPAPAAPMGGAERNAQRSLEVSASSIMPSADRDAAQSKLASMNQPATPAATPASIAAAAPGAGVASVPNTLGGSPQPPLGQPRPPYGSTTILVPRPAFADGGVVDPEERRGGLRGVADRIMQIPVDGYPKAPAADGSQNSWANTETGRNIVNAAAALPGAASAVPAIARTGGAISSGLNAASRLMNAGAAFAGMATPSPAAAAPSTAGAGRGSVNPPMVNPDAPLPVQPREEPQAQQDSVSAPASGDSYAPAAPRAGARERLLALAGMQADQAPAPQVPVIRHSGNDWQARNNLRNAEVSASSITNTRRWGGKGAEGSPEMLAYRSALANDNALQQAQPALEQEGMRQSGLSARERLIQSAENLRAEMGAERYDAANRIAAGELGLKQTAAGFQNRAAQRMENAQVAYEQATTPAQRLSARDRLLALAGKTRDDQWKAVALQGGTDAAGNKTESILGAVNERTGEMRRMDAGRPAAPAKDSLVRGQVYQTARGPAVWDGAQFRAQ